MRRVLIVFVKSPDGAVKTRLAKAVGQGRAREIYKRLAGQTLGRLCFGGYALRVAYHPPEDGAKVAAWLGDDIAYMPQAGRDLGERMENAFRDAFGKGAEAAVIIGSDIPDMTREAVEDAFGALESSGCAVAPTHDGGYCLIGFRAESFAPGAFRGMTWGADGVFDDTMKALSEAGVSTRVLPTLRDIDTPEDLIYLPPELRGGSISVIVPAYREAGNINASIGRLRKLPGGEGVEIIVVDGAPEGDTTGAIGDAEVITATSEKGRARQMNKGAEVATGDIFLFLHADTALPEGAFGMIREALDDGELAGGAFGLRFDSERLSMRLISWTAGMRSRMTRVPYGDQAIFLRRKYFKEMGGYEDIPLMEDVELMRRIRRSGGRIIILGASAVTSARKYLRDGVFFSAARNIALRMLYALGVSPDRLAKIYYRD